MDFIFIRCHYSASAGFSVVVVVVVSVGSGTGIVGVGGVSTVVVVVSVPPGLVFIIIDFKQKYNYFLLKQQIFIFTVLIISGLCGSVEDNINTFNYVFEINFLPGCVSTQPFLIFRNAYIGML